jgi:glycosyltransferase involved in cell wall biosynthesis
MAKPKLMGRQSAGYGFLKAAVQARGGAPIYGLVRRPGVAASFDRIVKEIDPAAPFVAIAGDESARIGDVGVLYLADLTVAAHARHRLRTGQAAYSLCGVTHTTASAGAMDEIVGLLREPVEPWDALVCTSSSVVETIRRVHEAEAEYLRWRFGAAAAISAPLLPVIPLGVHCDDYAIGEGARAAGRQALGLADDVVAALFVGRLVFHAKAHPFAMFHGLQAAARRTGKRIALLLCGYAPNDAIAEAFRGGAAQFAPDVDVRIVEGRDPILRGHAWASADLFVSLSDNIQETFGLTPIEAMAAGLPVVVSDWDGYRDTVRDGVDGFRIRTWSPPPGAGAPLARGFEVGTINYDHYCWYAAATTSVVLEELTDVLCRLIENPDLRRTLGDAGRRRARDVYDWPVVYRQYQALWSEQNARRAAARADAATLARVQAAPRQASSRLDPYDAFGHYPTAHIGPQTRLSLATGVAANTVDAALASSLFVDLPCSKEELQGLLAAAAAAGELSIADAAKQLGRNLASTTRSAGILAKIGAAMLRLAKDPA